jgi:hypothetical protein
VSPDVRAAAASAVQQLSRQELEEFAKAAGPQHWATALKKDGSPRQPGGRPRKHGSEYSELVKVVESGLRAGLNKKQARAAITKGRNDKPAAQKKRHQRAVARFRDGPWFMSPNADIEPPVVCVSPEPNELKGFGGSDEPE